MAKEKPENSDCFSASLWEELGLAEPEKLDERLAPQVDTALLRRVLAHDPELSERTKSAVFHLIDTFKSWREEYLRLSTEQ